VNYTTADGLRIWS